MDKLETVYIGNHCFDEKYNPEAKEKSFILEKLNALSLLSISESCFIGFASFILRSSTFISIKM
jgi:hypothetical protein